MLAKKIWDTLKVVDVSDHVEKKNGMSYLSWSFAWSTLMNHYPNTQIKYTDRTFQDGTVEYECTIRITDGEESVFQTMWLPVIDFRNKSVANPDAMARNTCKMRCLVKCISLFGLGINIYQGVLKLIETSGADLPKFLKVFDIIDLDDMPSEKYNLAVTSLKKKIKESDNDNT
jgi:hypothetical protein